VPTNQKNLMEKFFWKNLRFPVKEKPDFPLLNNNYFILSFCLYRFINSYENE